MRTGQHPPVQDNLSAGRLVQPGQAWFYTARVFDKQGRYDETAPRFFNIPNRTSAPMMDSNWLSVQP